MFIIWDRIYGTFADPASIKEPIAYGLVAGTGQVHSKMISVLDNQNRVDIKSRYSRHDFT